MFGDVLILGGLHGEGSGAEDLLVLHLVVVDEEADRRLGEVLEGHPSKGRLRSPPLLALEASHQGVQGGLVGGGPRLLALSSGFFLKLTLLSHRWSGTGAEVQTSSSFRGQSWNDTHS